MARTAARILDEYLVAAARAGEATAFDRLVRCWHGRLVAHARRLLGDPESARDAVQQGWIEIARGLHRLQDERAFPAWAYRIVSRVCYRQIGEAVQRRKLSEGIALQPAAEPKAGEAGTMPTCFAPRSGCFRRSSGPRSHFFISRN